MSSSVNIRSYFEQLSLEQLESRKAHLEREIDEEESTMRNLDGLAQRCYGTARYDACWEDIRILESENRERKKKIALCTLLILQKKQTSISSQPQTQAPTEEENLSPMRPGEKEFIDSMIEQYKARKWIKESKKTAYCFSVLGIIGIVMALGGLY